MLDQNTFTETIRAVQDIIRTSAEPMTREEILSYFKDMDLECTAGRDGVRVSVNTT